MKIKESKSEVMVDELMKKVFEIAKKESKEDTSYGLSKYLEDEFDKTKVKLKLLTFERYYNGYISKTGNPKLTQIIHSLTN